VEDSTGTILSSGGPYQDSQNGLKINEDICVQKGCHNFIFSDSYGDGLTDSGKYELIKDYTGDTIAQGWDKPDPGGNPVIVEETTKVCLPFSVNPLNTKKSCDSSCIGKADANASKGILPYNYQWNDPDSQTTPKADSLCPGKFYSVKVTDDSGKNVTDSVYIKNVKPKAIGAVTPDTLNLNNNNTASFNSSNSIGDSIIWAFSDNDTSTSPNPSKTYSDTGLYLEELIVTKDSNSCSDTDTVMLQVVNTTGIKEYNETNELGVTPNPFNERLKIKFKGSRENVLGEQAYQKRDINSNENFIQLELNELPKGVYFLKVRFENDKIGMKKVIKL
ncbi:MAG: PKD domain-containing protein, partial [Flavobacteriales bacterium]